MSRAYGQQCGVAKALDLLGERWTLMILRDLCAGSAGFNQLLRALRGIGPNLLSARLGQLQASGLVQAGEHGYALTPRGQALRPLLRTLMATGHFLGRPAGGGDAPVPARTVLGVLFDPLQASDMERIIEVQVGEERFTCFVSHGRLAIRPDAAPVIPDVRLQATAAGFTRAVSGAPPGEDFRLRGDAAALRDFRMAFALPMAPLRDTVALFAGEAG
ncbi:MAG: winged helix-turn-helix transcriptional regulator [Alcanivoracaceae bacterium]